VLPEAGLKRPAVAQDAGMSDIGLDRHEWEMRWQQLADVAEESPADDTSPRTRRACATTPAMTTTQVTSRTRSTGSGSSRNL